MNFSKISESDPAEEDCADLGHVSNQPIEYRWHKEDMNEDIL
jgi:hypothetical protein